MDNTCLFHIILFLNTKRQQTDLEQRLGQGQDQGASLVLPCDSLQLILHTLYFTFPNAEDTITKLLQILNKTMK